MNNVTQLVDSIGDLLELLSASFLHTYCIVLVAVLTALSYLYWWITYSKTSKLLMLQSQNKIDISSDNIDESFIENIISKSAPINKKSRKLMKIFYPIIFGCTFLFAVFGILFAVFMIEGDGYTVPKYELSVKSSSFSSDGVINLTLESDTEKDRTVTIKFTYLLDGEYTELTQDVSFSSSKTQSVTADLNSSNNFASVEYINTFYLDDGHYVDLPNFETRTYYLGGKEFAVINTELFFFNKSSFKCYIRVWHWKCVWNLSWFCSITCFVSKWRNFIARVKITHTDYNLFTLNVTLFVNRKCAVTVWNNVNTICFIVIITATEKRQNHTHK